MKAANMKSYLMNQARKRKLLHKRRRVVIKIKLLEKQIKFNKILIEMMKKGMFAGRGGVDVANVFVTGEVRGMNVHSGPSK